MTENEHLYEYKQEVQVPPLAMVDDLLIVTECGNKTVMANSYINAKSNLKKLQFGTDKCHKMHVGRKKVNGVCPDIYVDGWKVKEVSEVETGESTLLDEFDGQEKMDEVSEEKYLGDILSDDGRNMKNILARAAKGTGIVSQIMCILEEIFFGKYYFEVAVVLRNSLLLSSVLVNSEAWYNLKKEEIEKLEQVDEMLLRKVLECPGTTPKEMVYLELNCVPIRFIIKSRRLNFLSYILREDKSSLMYCFLKAQLRNPSKNDWVQTVMEDMKELNIDLEIEEIENIPVETYKDLIRSKIQEGALEYLNNQKSKHSKVLHIMHDKMTMQDYLCPNEINQEEAKFIFQLRTRMVDVKTNYGGRHTDDLCPLCKDEEDTQQHLLVCPHLDGAEVALRAPDYEDLFREGVQPKIKISRIMHSRYAKRKVLLKKEKEDAKGPSDPECWWW